jgi:hypothetical protein
MRVVNAEQFNYSDDFSKRQCYKVQLHPEHPDRYRGALILPNPITVHV